jgi:penicillin amidase
MVSVPDTQLVLSLVEAATPETRNALFDDTLAAAWAEAVALLGSDPATWAWGRLHRGYFEHPLSRFAPDLAAKLDVGPAPKGGSNLTINNNGWRAADFRVVSGVSWRMVVDVGDWDASFTINSPGQSGDPASPHYRDLFPLWARDEYVPLLFSRAAIEAAAEARIRLVPAAASA